jgi:CheY-like chemotaxis protein
VVDSPFPAPAVLVVEDDVDIREVLQEVLDRRGYPTTGVADGAGALDVLRTAEQLPGLILLDLMMPGMDGWQFLSARAAEPRLAAIPVILMSALDHVTAPEPGLRWDLVVKKPVRLGDLLETIARFFPGR